MGRGDELAARVAVVDGVLVVAVPARRAHRWARLLRQAIDGERHRGLPPDVDGVRELELLDRVAAGIMHASEHLPHGEVEVCDNFVGMNCIADQVGVHRTTVSRWINAGLVRVRRVDGRTLLVHAGDVAREASRRQR